MDARGEVRYRSQSAHEHLGPAINSRQLKKLREVISEFDASSDKGGVGGLPEICVRDAEGRERHLTISVGRMLFAGDPAHLLSFADVTYIRKIEDELRILNAEAQRLATIDPLTGIHNRRHFMIAAKAALKHMRQQKLPAAIFLLDLDHFKTLNDRFGHDFGDRALVQAAEAARLHMRHADIFARVGGEEFAGFLPDANLEAAAAIAERLRAAIAHLRIEVDDKATGLTCSIGLTAVDVETDTLESAMKRADESLYAAKREGRDRVRTRQSPQDVTVAVH
jgi:diguanylate cyclase (GGDEF)-like protein